MLFQYASDLHINDWPQGTPFSQYIVPASPFLILAGDICSATAPQYKAFLTWTSRLWHTVLVVAGNHEYHNTEKKTMGQIDAHISDICKKLRNVHYLQNGASVSFPGMRVVGATLWSDVDPAIWSEAVKKKGDCLKIYVDGPRLLTPADICAMHASQRRALATAICPSYPGERVVVVTHHMPSKRLLEDRFRGEAWHTFYASNSEDLFAPHVSLWICGHSHRAYRLKLPAGPLLLMNARGYNKPSEMERVTEKYNPAQTQKVI